MSASKAFHEEFAARVIAMLENGTAPWQKPWTPAKELAPYNPFPASPTGAATACGCPCSPRAIRAG